MRRTQIYLTDAEAEALRRQTKRTGASMSELIRSAIEETYIRGAGQPTKEEALRIIDETAGAWTDRTETGAEYVERIRPGLLGRRYGRRP